MNIKNRNVFPKKQIAWDVYMSSLTGWSSLPPTFAGCGRWGIQRYFAWIKNPKPMKEKKKEKLVSPNGHAPAVTGGRRDSRRQFLFFYLMNFY